MSRPKKIKIKLSRPKPMTKAEIIRSQADLKRMLGALSSDKK